MSWHRKLGIFYISLLSCQFSLKVRATAISPLDLEKVVQAVCEQNYIKVNLSISAEIRGGFMIKNLEFMRHSMRFNIMEGNKYAATTCASYGYDVLDMHFYMVSFCHLQAPSGFLFCRYQHYNEISFAG